MHREEKEIQWEKQQRKSANSFCNKNVSSLHLENRAGSYRWQEGDVLSPLYTPWPDLHTPQSMAKKSLSGGSLTLEITCFRVPWWFVVVSSDWCAFPLLFPRLFLLRLSDPWRAAKGGAMVGIATSRGALAPLPALVGHLLTGQALSFVIAWTDSSNYLCFFCPLMSQRSRGRNYTFSGI